MSFFKDVNAGWIQNITAFSSIFELILTLLGKDILNNMNVKTYGIYDSVQEEYVRTFTATNDADAKRTASLIVRSQGFNDKEYVDRSIHHLFDFDTATGQITDNTVRQIFLFATAIEDRKNEQLEAAVKEKLATDEFKQELKDLILHQVQGEIKNEQERKC